MLKGILIISLSLINIAAIAQLQVRVTGTITDEQNLPLQNVSISIIDQNTTVLSNKNGEYTIYSKSTNFLLTYSLLGYYTTTDNIFENKLGRISRNVILKNSINELEQVAITSKKDQLSNTIGLNIKDLVLMPSPSGNFETILKTLPGVSVNNELTAQYSVRGGNYEDNALYLNDVEINRPVYVRNSQQEGLSFINQDLVSRARFSAGGYEARYADKMASVLDVKYEMPDSNEIKISPGLLNSSLSYKRKFKNDYFLFGARYKNNSGLQIKQDIKGRFSPNFADIQVLYNSNLSQALNLTLLGNINGGTFNLIPENRYTDFGTHTNNGQLYVNYEGKERTSYFSSGGAVIFNFFPDPSWSIKFINSYFSTIETENTNVLGSYFLNGLTPNSNTGYHWNYADNFLKSNTFISELKAEQNLGNHIFSWGAKLVHKRYKEEYNEFSEISTNANSLVNNTGANQLNNIGITYLSAFVQDSYEISDYSDLQVGVRGTFNEITKKVAISPRLLFAYRPPGENKILRFSLGVYNQDPDFRTLKNMDGSIIKNQDFQRSYNATLGYDHAFNAFGTRVKFTSEFYYKYQDKLIPYTIDNMRIRYFSNQMAVGNTYGADFTLGGELVKDLLSYFRVSLMKSNQRILSSSLNPVELTQIENKGALLKRPTDQLLNFSVFFQDRLPQSPAYKVHLNLMYGSNLPLGVPDLPYYTDNFRIPSYKRVDIGFSKDFLDPILKLKNTNWLGKQFGSFIAYMEIFNLLNMNNTASYLWVKDVNGAQYAVPNFHTGRQLNIRLIGKLKNK